MNYNHPDLLDRLAAEYALGTLRGQARLRFERLCRELPEARAAAQRWENRLAGLTAALPEQEPSPAVWRRIEQQLDTRAGSDARFWRNWAIAASIALIAISALFTQTYLQESEDQLEIAVVNEANSVPLWVVSIDFDTGMLSTRAINAEALGLDKVYQLWMLPEAGSPQSLGLLPINGQQVVRTFSPALLDLLRKAEGLAVSIEPPGGSPLSTPSGPVVYQTTLLAL
ncbi:MAG: anti-sigma factor [Pseudomonadota bacterium]